MFVSGLTTMEIRQRLRARYSAPEYALVEEVPNATSWNKRRTADAIAMGCWKKVGIHLNGFEIKATRSDWRRELNDLGKSAEISKFCHRWWIVADRGVVKKDEMPDNWGLLEPHGQGLKVSKAAALVVPEPVSFDFLAGLLRKAVNEGVAEDRLRAQFKAGYDSGMSAAGQQESNAVVNAERARDRVQRRLEQFENSLAEFENESGISITQHNGREMGSAVRLLLNLVSTQRRLDDIAQIAQFLLEAAQGLNKHIEDLQE